ncbi:thiol reductant ABC exporter subunit CydD [Oceanobacillus massiliensis]|uniref:thiol reductant ABC exporter subunit CydD n=1 Tax=Oceanobacillus massiliensis TaxID=1465765 RepID=UPI0002896531|nr:thiol reductant ABC exporter subunit CydD [Oceanobacillus massiliensis]
MGRLKQMVLEQKSKMILLIVLAALSGLAIIGQGYLLVMIVDRIFIKDYGFSEAIPFLVGLLVALLARTVLTFMNGRIGIKMSSHAKATFRRSLLNRFSSNPMETSVQGQSGKKVSLIMDTVDEVDSYFSSYIPQVIQSSIIPIMVLVIIFMEHWTTGVIILITAPFIPVFMMVIGFKTKDKSEKQLDRLAAFSGIFLDTLQGLPTLKLFGRSREQKERIRQSSIDFRDATMDVLKVAFTNSLALEFISMLSVGLVALEVAVRMIIFQDITFYTGFLMLILAPEFYSKLKDLGSAFHTGRTSMGAVKKLEEELSEMSQTVQWGENRLHENPADSRIPTLEIIHAGFSYGAGAFTLKDIHTVIQPYDQVAIIGKTGSGKSTLLNMIAGLSDPLEGEIRINGKNRKEILEKDWFDNISYISQNPYLFSGTIADNIAIGAAEEATREAIIDASQKAGIAELINSLEDAYDTPIGEAGRGLSGGERQRIAIARSFLKHPSIILFDEPTTGLDLQTEQILTKAIQELGESSTVITVAHRLHTIKNADLILLMDKGELIASGTHDELLKSDVMYRDMITVQQGGMAQ